ncbi:hypothetical protein BDU57DRAFT_598010 [Ampelomyces quisqualis]|uniref:Uncharacterized protein n=1 Tax=Ampelomyces quisqualis TaxID=50730 RepID=A0A6A5QCG9_AMPQU|nr:hypothetical protein BDU57DRAFT_598010 [Ampelomyces quisqualis]
MSYAMVLLRTFDREHFRSASRDVISHGSWEVGSPLDAHRRLRLRPSSSHTRSTPAAATSRACLTSSSGELPAGELTPRSRLVTLTQSSSCSLQPVAHSAPPRGQSRFLSPMVHHCGASSPCCMPHGA